MESGKHGGSQRWQLTIIHLSRQVKESCIYKEIGKRDERITLFAITQSIKEKRGIEPLFFCYLFTCFCSNSVILSFNFFISLMVLQTCQKFINTGPKTPAK